MSPYPISSRRQLLQLFLLLVLFITPFLSVAANPFLRLDIPARTLFLAGVALRFDELFFVLLLILTLLALFFLITTILGRVWCGWLCPQTVVNDMLDRVAGWLAQPFASPAMKRVARHATAVLFSLLLTTAILGWFMPPAAVGRLFLAPSANPPLWFCAALTAVLLYLDMTVVRREFCRGYCPYGRFQSALMDEGTLNLAFRREARAMCTNCRSCVRACPMGIDIRQGFQIECINCGRCIDACRDMMERRTGGAGEGGLIAYRFGETAGGRPRVGVKTMLLTSVFMLLFAALFWNVRNRTEISFLLQRVATADTKILPDGSRVTAWRAVIGNRRQSPALFTISAEDPAGAPVMLLGPVTDLRVAPNENLPVVFSIRMPAALAASPPAVELRLTSAGTTVTTRRITP